MENDAEKENEKEGKNRRNKIIKGTIISICILLIIYFGMAAYFTKHFYFGSEINGVNVSGKTAEQLNTELTSQIKSYKLNLKERGSKSEQISGSDIKLKYSSDNEFRKLKDKQGNYKWIIAFLDTNDTKMTAAVSYDNKLLEDKIDKLSCLDSKNVIEPKNPSFKYSDKGYNIVSEVYGSKVDKTALYNNVVKAISKGETTLDLEATNCYVNPKYTVKSPKTTQIRDLLNKYVSSKIIYTFGDKKETVDGSKINNWLTVNDNFEVEFDKDKIKKYMLELSKTYDTIGKTRSFVTTSGRTISVGGGDYGWDIDSSKETENLITYIKQGGTVKKEPAYSQTAASRGANDIGNTYVEVDLSDQHLWFYKNGSLVVQGDVVTGNVSQGHPTPEGVYWVKYKERHATLKGEGYSSPVDYWMPFNGGIGIHDASWRSSFGGSIYMSDGSHGCVNSPYYLASTIYQNIDKGTPVVCYY